MYAYESVEPTSIFLQGTSTIYFETEALTGTGWLTGYVGWTASEDQRTPSLLFPSTGIMSEHLYTWLFNGCLRSNSGLHTYVTDTLLTGLSLRHASKLFLNRLCFSCYCPLWTAQILWSIRVARTSKTCCIFTKSSTQSLFSRRPVP